MISWSRPVALAQRTTVSSTRLNDALHSVNYALDITYESLARSFSLPLRHHQETLDRMAEFSKNRIDIQNQNAEQRTARERMALFPYGDNVEVLYLHKELWVVSSALVASSR